VFLTEFTSPYILNTQRDGTPQDHVLRRNCLLKRVIERKIERMKDRSDGETRKKTMQILFDLK